VVKAIGIAAPIVVSINAEMPHQFFSFIFSFILLFLKINSKKQEFNDELLFLEKKTKWCLVH
jgi:hypothetical protein